MKKEIRILGIDDAPFPRRRKTNVLVVGCFYRGGDFMDGLVSTHIKQDGMNATEKLVKMVAGSKFYSQLQCIMLDGIALGGFNVVDIHELSEKTKLPVIVIIRDMPDFEKIRKALSNLSRGEKRFELMIKAGKPKKLGKVYVQKAGISLNNVKKILKIACTHSYVPEPIRIAHIIGQGIKKGQSSGRA